MEVAAQQQRLEMLLAGRTANRALMLWGRVNPASIKASWGLVAPALYVAVARAQSEVAQQADPYLERIASAQDAVSLTEAPVNARGYTGVASDGRSLEGALLTGPLTALSGIAAGMSVADAMDAGRNALKAMVTTQVADAFRASSQVSMFMRDPDDLPDDVRRGKRGRLFVKDGNGRERPYFRPKFYVRMVQPGACSRCIVLAGVRYRRREAFNRHPNCHCTHIPVDENLADVPETDPKAYFDNLSPAEQDKAFTKAGAEAIRAGADMNQVVNARRGMSYAGVSSDGTHRGQKLASPFTTEGVTKRGLFGVTQTDFKKTPDSRYQRAVQRRLTPEEIFRRAKTREEAVRLLRENAFIY
jgi:hypothetical protein